MEKTEKTVVKRRKRRKRWFSMKDSVIEFLVLAAIIIAVLAASWGLACLLMWLASVCFNIGFSIKIATGIWLLLFLVGGAFKSTSSSSK